MLPKAYDPQATEDNIYKMWEETGASIADVNSKKDPFVISMPPPNATGQLHLGHAVMLALEDIFIRFHRMNGKEALWVPGTDHAAIATENVVIKKLKDEAGINDPREELGREKLLEEIREFVEGSRGTIRSQVRKMGSSCDWSRERYTMEPALNRCVNEVFVRMYKDGLIYRGPRIVNWDPNLQTNVSDDEVEYIEKTDPFYVFQYGPFQIGTVRPETKFGDKYVVMHPDDKRYKKYKHGDTFECEWINGTLTATIIKDEAVDPEMGSGCMTITPWHSHVDFEIAERHELDKEQIIDFEGNLLANAGEFAGMHITEARPKIVEKLKDKGLLVKTDENYEHTVATNSRGGGTIEPQIRKQWFIDVNRKVVEWKGVKRSLKEVMQDVVHSGDIEIIPERFNKTYFHWIDNLRDWCISRQIWWGHRIPVWYKHDSGAEDMHIGVQAPEGASSAKGSSIIFARHGQSEGNRDHVAQGSDDPLTEKGKEHADKLKDTLKGRSITKIISSPNPRALDTAKTVAEEFGLTVETWDDLSCFDMGDVTGTPSVEGKSDPERAVETGTGESLEHFFDRAKTAWEKLSALKSDGDILVVGHRTNLATIDLVRNGGSSADILESRNKAENAAHGVWGEVPLSSSDWQQDPDTLDTWFSAALWTWSTLVDPKLTEDFSLSLEDILKNSPDFQKFHPTQVMETGYDIIFFWVARMILMTTYATGQIPFEKVYLHGLIRTREGKKMSKSDPSTMIDPLDIIPKYGADALRLSMIVGQSPGNDSKLFDEKIAGYRNFINKLWNASRFVLMQCEDVGVDPAKLPAFVYAQSDNLEDGLSLADKALLSELQKLIEDVSEGLEEYRLSEVGESLYSFIWDYFCDWYLELSKGELNPNVLVHALRTLLHLLHPYCPFVTEELWKYVGQKDSGTLLKAEWPQSDESLKNEDSASQLQMIIDAITAIRSMRSEQGIDQGKKIPAAIHTKHLELFESQKEHIVRLGRLDSLEITAKPEKHDHAASTFLKDVEVHLLLEGVVDFEAEKKKLEEEKKKLEGFITGIEKKLSNKKFVEGAPEQVVALEKEKLESNQEKLKKIEERLSNLA